VRKITNAETERVCSCPGKGPLIERHLHGQTELLCDWSIIHVVVGTCLTNIAPEGTTSILGHKIPVLVPIKWLKGKVLGPDSAPRENSLWQKGDLPLGRFAGTSSGIKVPFCVMYIYVAVNLPVPNLSEKLYWSYSHRNCSDRQCQLQASLCQETVARRRLYVQHKILKFQCHAQLRCVHCLLLSHWWNQWNTQAPRRQQHRILTRLDWRQFPAETTTWTAKEIIDKKSSWKQMLLIRCRLC